MIELNGEIPLTTAWPIFENEEILLADIKNLLASGQLTNRGRRVQEFESRIKEYIGDPSLHVVTCSNGTLGLELMLRALDLRGEVIVPSFTYVSTAAAVINAGLKPVFADIDSETLCLSAASVENALTPQTSAILPVHIFGTLSHNSFFERLSGSNIKVVYDAAHSFGVTAGAQNAVACGDAEIFSFNATKILNSAEGGAAITRNAELAERFRRCAGMGLDDSGAAVSTGTNAKMSELHALLGLHSLKTLTADIEKRRHLIEFYDHRFKFINFLRRPKTPEGSKSNGQYYPVVFETPRLRDAVFESLREERITAKKYFSPPVHEFAFYSKFKRSELKVTEDIAGRVLCLPLHSRMTEAHVDMVANRVIETAKRVRG